MSANDRRHIIIVALRRSGTTALWRLFRQDPGYVCYDEPFGRLLRDLPREHRKSTRAEFIELFNRDPERFRAMYAPIQRSEETARGMTSRQREYFRFLASGGAMVADLTRCHGKIPELHEVLPDAVMVHLYRRPAAFASSHLIPSDRADLFGIREWMARRSTFTRRRGFNAWGMEELLREPHAATTRALLEPEGVRFPEPGSTAAELLVAHWLGSWRVAEREGRAAFGERFLSLEFEDFCASPDIHLRRIYDAADAPRFDFDLSGLGTPSAGHLPHDARWERIARAVGFTDDEIGRFIGAPARGPRGGGSADIRTASGTHE